MKLWRRKKIYEYTMCYMFGERGIVIAENETKAREKIMNAYPNEVDYTGLEIKEVHSRLNNKDVIELCEQF